MARQAESDPQPGQPDTSRVVARALDVALALAAADGLTRAELALRLNLPATTVLRLLTTLSAARMAEMDPATQRWTVGPAAFRLGAAFLHLGAELNWKSLFDALLADFSEAGVAQRQAAALAAAGLDDHG